MSLANYLQQHFVDKQAFAAMCGMTAGRLDRLIALQAIPAATYVCDGRSIASAVFGRTPIDEALTGEFFRPECARWATIAGQAAEGAAQDAVLAQLVQELRSALQEHLADPATIEAKIQGYLPGFWNGTFGLCVADPSTGHGIVRKEILQERLTAITANGGHAHPDGISASSLLALIDDYADAAMPFSPAEYARSSRKRLVDDLRPRVASCLDPA